MRSPSDASYDPDPALADVCEAVNRRLEAGEPVDLDALIAEHPQQADQLRQILPALELMDELRRLSRQSSAGGVSTSRVAAPQAEQLDGTLGDFRILREIGRGGMGIVYEARQISLPRRVALKTLPFAAVLDPKQLQRFKNEAGAAASLDHPNIVTIYSVGCERGVHYYAMQFVEGQTLAGVIDSAQKLTRPESEAALPGPFAELTRSLLRRRLEACENSGTGASQGAESAACSEVRLGASTIFPQPLGAERGSRDADAATEVELHPADPEPESADTPLAHREFFRTAAHLGIQAAEALEHAHQMGVVHRDVKPSNLMVDATGHLWVTDFGLAMTSTDGKLTMTGDLLGTLRYMSPEQVQAGGRVLDHRTDIYSLGVTLYELLTLRPAVTSSDQHEVIHQITESDPQAIRRINHRVPRDLETIVQKAMAKEPRARYATAKDMADDLRHFLDDQPIRAKRPSPADRLGRWARRRRAILATGVLTLVAAILLAGLLLWHERNQTLDALAQVVEERTVAERHYQRAEEQKEAALRQRDLSDRNLYLADMRLAAHYWNTGRRDGLLTLLSALSPDSGCSDFRGWEWYYFFSQCHTEKFLFPCQGGNTFAWSPHGEYLATVGSYGVSIWEARSGKRKSFAKTGSGILSLAWSPEAKRLAIITTRDTVEIWDIASARLGKWNAMCGFAFALDWSPDGSRLAFGDDGRIRIWDPQTGKTLSTIDVPGKTVWSLDWHPDSRRLLAVVGVVPNVAEQLRIWDTAGGGDLGGWPTDGQQACFSPDGRRVAWGSNLASVSEWETGRLVASFQQRGRQNAAFSPDGKWLASPADGGPIRIWEADTGKQIRHIQAPLARGGRLAWSPAGSLLAAGCEEGVAVWDVEGAQEALTLSLPGRYALAVRFSPDGKRLLVGARYGLMNIYDVDSGKTTLTVKQPEPTWLRCVAWKPDGKQFAVRWAGHRVAVCDAATGKESIPLLTFDGDEPRSLAWRPGGTVLAVGVQNKRPGALSGHGRVVLVCTDTGRRLAASDYADWSCEAVAWSPDSNRLAASGKRLRIWDFAVGGPDETGTGSRPSSDDLVTKQSARVPVTVLSGPLEHLIATPDIPAVFLSWSPDGRQLAVAGGTTWDHGDGTIRIYDTTSWARLADLTQSVGDLACLGWHPRHPRLASGSQGGTVRIWDTSSGQEVVRLETSAATESHRMQQLDWSPDGLRLASASQDGLVRIWDASRAARVLARQNLRARLSDLRAKKKFQEAIDLLQSLPADENETAPHFRPSSDHRGNSANATVQVPDLSDDLEVEMLLQQFQLDRARQMVRDGELDAATILYRQLSADSPELPDPRLLLADALFYPGNEAKALQWLENVVAESPENEDYGDKLAFRYQLAAISLCRAGRFDEAVPILTKLAGRFPDRRDFRPHLAALMAVAHRLKETIAMFEKVTVPPAWPDYRPELARRLLALLNDPEVVAFYRQMTADFPDVPEYRRGLGSVRLTDGVALFSAGDWQESLEPLSEAVELLAPLVISESQGPPDYDLTNRLWEAYHRRAGSRLNLGELDGAIADYSEAIRVVPDDPMPYCWRAVAYLKRGEIDKARVDCEAYLKLPRSCGCTPLAQTLAERLRPGGAPKWALAVARKTVELSPESAEAWKSLGLLHVAAGDRHQAAIALKQAVELAPGDESLRSLLDEEPRQTTPEEPKQ